MLPWASSPQQAIVTEDRQTTHAATFRIPAQHPALAGHFPGNPVVPGVLVLDAVLSAAQAWLGREFRGDRLSHAKFLAPLKPGETAQIEMVLRAPRLEFCVYCGTTLIAKGAFGSSREPAR
jgi:3-hydroxyacyl-[acyl-carrier-protein] dehydratase